MSKAIVIKISRDVTRHWLFHYCVLIYQDTVGRCHSLERKTNARLHMFIFNCCVMLRCHYQCAYSVFVREHTWLTLRCPHSASVWQHCHSLSLAGLHMPLKYCLIYLPRFIRMWTECQALLRTIMWLLMTYYNFFAYNSVFIWICGLFLVEAQCSLCKH